MQLAEALTVRLRSPVLDREFAHGHSLQCSLRRDAVRLEYARGGMKLEGVPLLREMKDGVQLCFCI